MRLLPPVEPGGGVVDVYRKYPDRMRQNSSFAVEP